MGTQTTRPIVNSISLQSPWAVRNIAHVLLSSNSRPSLNVRKPFPCMHTCLLNHGSPPTINAAMDGHNQSPLLNQQQQEEATKMSANSQDIRFKAGEMKGQTDVKTDQMANKASNAAQSCKDSMQNAGEQVKSKAQGAADAVKDAVGMNKK
ncbi:hypothetical protein QJS04_geneDACA002277 [Acorus gramineus]|uniref:Uncharacterized protein n=1 Tax=Acorus gramineus TaxID=55184 RepID=A0AAV9AAT7_ACOGR|nr:hypothetical protein QJS04_geneDACA002277 [Acorus gramineus]